MTGCLEGLVNAVSEISAAVRASNCCYGGPGAGAIQVGDDFYYGSEDPLNEPTAFGSGEEFATEAEYIAHKCATANAIVNSMIATLEGFTVVSLVQLTAGSVVLGLVGAGLLVAPPVALMIALLVTGFAVAVFSTLANAMDANKDSLVCLLFEASGAIDAYSDFKTGLEDIAVDIGVLEVQLGPLSDLLMNLAPIDTMNALFTAVGLPAVPGDVVDCATCGDCPDYVCTKGTYDPITGVLNATWNAALERYEAFILFNRVPGEDPCDSAVTLTVVENNPPAPTNNGLGHRAWNGSNTLIYSSDTPPTAAANVQSYNCIDYNTPFSVTLTF
ncbi:MAG: hypothetical protein PVJ67_07200 [Candidatus Pacearchaeota archaeon]|jgi:hypothetical protein